MRGRRPDPGRRRRGTGHRPLPAEVIVKAEATPPLETEPAAEPPQHLSDEAKAIWREAVRRLGGPLHPADVFALEAMVDQFDTMREAARYRRQYGILVEVRKAREDQPAVYEPAPWVRMERDAALAFLRFAEQLGLTRLARTRLGVLNVAGATMMEALLRDLESE